MAEPLNPDEVRLPDRTESYAAYLQLKSELLGLAVERSGDEVAWIVLPSLLAILRAPAAQKRPDTTPIGRPELLREELTSRAFALRGEPLLVRRAGDYMLSGGGHSVARLLGQISSGLGTGAAEPEPPTLGRLPLGSPLRLRDLSRRATELTVTLLDRLDTAGVPLPWPRRRVAAHAQTCVRRFATFELLMKRKQPKALLVTTTAAPLDRAALAASRQAGVPSVYLPHGSTVLEPEVNDLVTDYVGLHGPRDVSYYEVVGAERDRLDIAGRPSITAAPRAQSGPGSGPVVFAPSDAPRDELVAMISLVQAAAPGDIFFSPHPLTGKSLVADLTPSDWHSWEGRTIDLIDRGVAAVIQNSSGVALEAALRGVQPIELVFPGRPGNIALANDRQVIKASGSAQVAEALAWVANPPVGAPGSVPVGPDALAGWAATWSDPIGAQATEAAIALLERAAEHGPVGPILDFWGRIPSAP